jgi:hypothetical protein
MNLMNKQPPSSSEYWTHLQPKETIASADQDTANAAALCSQVFFHISKDNLDYDESKFHPALIQNTDE